MTVKTTVSNQEQSEVNLRNETLDGVEYVVTNTIAIREGVYLYPADDGRGLKREFLPKEEIANTAVEWEGQPITLNHPSDSDGVPGLIDDPETSFTEIGAFLNTELEDDALIGEVWIRKDEVGEHGGKLEGYINSLPGEVSTGYRAGTEFDRGKYNDQRYTFVQRDPTPDHLALLVDERGNCSLEDGCGAGKVINQMPRASESGVRINNRRATSNVTPEQVAIVQEIVDDFAESQGDATVGEMHTWVRENDDLDADDKTAIQSMFDTLFDHDPSEWTVEGEFSAWLDRRADSARENTLDDISEASGVALVDEGLDGSDTQLGVLRNIHDTLNRMFGGEEPQGDMDGADESVRANEDADGEQTEMQDTTEKLVNEYGISREHAEALDGSECSENILNAFEEANEASEEPEGGAGEPEAEVTNEIEERFDAIEEKFESQLEEKENRIEELEAEMSQEKEERENALDTLLTEKTELGEETIEGMGLESKQNLASDLGVEEGSQEEETVNMNGMAQNVPVDFDDGDDLDIPMPGSGAQEDDD